MDLDDWQERLSALRRQVGARAAGVWRLAPDALELLAFDADPGMPVAIADGFASVTRRAGLDRPEFGIVAAILDGRPRVSEAAELPDDRGSGYWLRAFDAARSIAVPISDDDARPIGLVSIAMPAASVEPTDRLIDVLRSTGTRWFAERGDHRAASESL